MGVGRMVQQPVNVLPLDPRWTEVELDFNGDGDVVEAAGRLHAQESRAAQGLPAQVVIGGGIAWPLTS